MGQCQFSVRSVSALTYNFFFGFNLVLNLNVFYFTGDILVFLPGQEEIEKVGDMLYGKLEDISSLDDQLLIIHCYGGLSMDEQQKMFDPAPPNYRKVVLATNIAETSITIDGIVYVVDCGFFKLKEYNSKSGLQSLVTKRITQVVCKQCVVSTCNSVKICDDFYYTFNFLVSSYPTCW